MVSVRTFRFAVYTMAGAAAVLLSAACSDRIGLEPRPVEELPKADRLALVSNPVSVGEVAAHSRAALSIQPSGGLVYVSLPPGSAPQADSAVIRNRRTGAAAVVPMHDGGFDPVPVVANVADTLEIRVQSTGGGSGIVMREAVPANRGPIIVRTRPPKGARDVPLNARLMIVFSEPVDPTTLTAASVQLLRGGVQVPGTVEAGDSAHLTATFTPALPLEPGTLYRLVVAETIRDLDGDALVGPASIDFTTTDVTTTSYIGGIVFSAQQTVWVVNEDGSDLRPVSSTCDRRACWGDEFGVWSPDGSMVAFVRSGYPFGEVRVSDMRGSERVVAREHGYGLAWSPDGSRIAYVTQGWPQYVRVVAADGGSPPRSLSDGSGEVTWSPDGTRIVFWRDWYPSANVSRSAVFVVNADGTGLTDLTSGLMTNTLSPRLSPRGDRIAFAWLGALHIMKPDGSDLTSVVSPLALDGWFDWSPGPPRWSPDGSKLAFVANNGDAASGYYPSRGLYVVNADGSGLELLVRDDDVLTRAPPTWSPDGTRLAFVMSPHRWTTGDGHSDIYVIGVDGSGMKRVTPAGFDSIHSLDWR